MENYVSEQLVTLLAALLLGAVGAWLYDLLRAVRLKRKSRLLTHLTDGVYVGLCLLALLGFALHRGEGELRLYMLLGIFLGTVAYFLLLSRSLRPLWDFWAEAAAAFGHVLVLPIRYLLKICKKVFCALKKYFQFAKKYAKIKKYKWNFARIRNRSMKRGGRRSREQAEKGEEKP